MCSTMNRFGQRVLESFGGRTPASRSARRALALAVVVASLTLGLAATSHAEGGDFSLAFGAAAPGSYDLATGGGAYNEGVLTSGENVVLPIGVGDVTCGGVATYLVSIQLDQNSSADPQTIEVDLAFSGATTGEAGVGFDGIAGVSINYGCVQNGTGSRSGCGAGERLDSGIQDDGGSTATLIAETFVGELFSPDAEVRASVRVDDLEAGEHVVVRVDVAVACDADPNTRATGKLVGRLLGARATAPDSEAGAVPVVTTDKLDYAPGSTALIAGGGFGAGERVELQVLHGDGTPQTGAGHHPWFATADASGEFTSTWHVCEDDCVGSVLELTAKGETSGVRAAVRFTDADPQFLDNRLKRHAVWDNTDQTYELGNPAGYAEGDTASFLVEIETSGGGSGDDFSNGPLEFKLNVHLDLDDDPYGFTDLEPFDTTFTPTLPSRVPLTLSDVAPAVGGPNGTVADAVSVFTASHIGVDILSVTYVGVTPTGSGVPVPFQTWTIVFSVDAATTGPEEIVIVYGGHLAQAGDVLPDPPGGVVPAPDPNTHGASGISGTFQARVESGGDKTVNFKGPDLPLLADVSLSKTVDDPTPDVGSNVVFTVEVTNDGPEAATGVTVADPLPSGYAYASDDGGGDYDSGTGLWTVGDLASSTSATLLITATVNATGNYDNYAQVVTAAPGDPDSTPGDDSVGDDDDATASTTPTPIADVSLTKGVDESTPDVGTDVVFSIVVSNAGPSAATGVEVTDLLPTGYTYVSDDSGGDYVAGTGVWAVGDVANGGSATLSITATVNATGNFDNYAQITAADREDPDSAPGDDSTGDDDDATVSTTPTPIADLTLAKNVDVATPDVGSDVVFTITVNNAGPSEATGVIVTDELPVGYTYVSDDGGGDYDANTGEWAVGSVSSGGSAVLEITATVNAKSNGSDEYSNFAQVTTSNEEDPTSSPNNGPSGEDDEATETTTPTPVADLSLSKTVAPTTQDVGAEVTFTLIVTNDGPSVATDVTVSDQLPTGYTFVSSVGPGTYVSDTGVWTIGSLGDQSVAMRTITARVNATGSYTNLAEIATSGQEDPDSTPGNGSDNEDDDDADATTPNPVADLSLTKDASNDTP
ncbi:MAG: hypothetical protein ACYS22_07460, partial [Planctomycetota bacterium]